MEKTLEGKENCVDSLNILRVIATFSVFMLHTTLFEPGINDLFASGGYCFLLRTPAWSGVWIFMILGGYLAGKGFAQGRYTFSAGSIRKYYGNRIRKTIIPTFCFILICVVLCFPSFLVNNLRILMIRLFTFTYAGDPGVNGIGATWYVFTVFWLYLLTPPVAWMISKIRDRRAVLWVILATLAAAGALWRTYAFQMKMTWYNGVYVTWYLNLDLYMGGVVFSFLNQRKAEEKKTTITERTGVGLKVVAFFLLIIGYVTNCYFYNRSAFGSLLGTALSGYYYQTIWLAICIVFIAAFDNPRSAREKISLKTVIRNPMRIIDAFASISFEFYLFHSLILDRIAAYVVADRELSWLIHVQLLLIAGVLTIVFSIGFHRVFEDRK